MWNTHITAISEAAQCMQLNARRQIAILAETLAEILVSTPIRLRFLLARAFSRRRHFCETCRSSSALLLISHFHFQRRERGAPSLPPSSFSFYDFLCKLADDVYSRFSAFGTHVSGAVSDRVLLFHQGRFVPEALLPFSDCCTTYNTSRPSIGGID